MNEISGLLVPKMSSFFLLVKKCISYNNGACFEESILVFFLSDDLDSLTFKAHSEKLFLVIFSV